MRKRLDRHRRKSIHSQRGLRGALGSRTHPTRADIVAHITVQAWPIEMVCDVSCRARDTRMARKMFIAVGRLKDSIAARPRYTDTRMRVLGPLIAEDALWGYEKVAPVARVAGVDALLNVLKERVATLLLLDITKKARHGHIRRRRTQHPHGRHHGNLSRPSGDASKRGKGIKMGPPPGGA